MTAFRAAPLPPPPVQQQANASIGSFADQQASAEENDPVKLIERLVEQISILNGERLKKIA